MKRLTRNLQSSTVAGVNPYRCSARFEEILFTRGNGARTLGGRKKGLINFRRGIWSIDGASRPCHRDSSVPRSGSDREIEKSDNPDEGKLHRGIVDGVTPPIIIGLSV